MAIITQLKNKNNESNYYALGHVQRADAIITLEVTRREYHLVHARSVVGQIVVALQLAHDVVGVDNRVLADLRYSLFSQGADVGVGAD